MATKKPLDPRIAARLERTYAAGVVNANVMIRVEEEGFKMHPEFRTWTQRLDRLTEQMRRFETFGRDECDRGNAETLRNYIVTQRPIVE